MNVNRCEQFLWSKKLMTFHLRERRCKAVKNLPRPPRTRRRLWTLWRMKGWLGIPFRYMVEVHFKPDLALVNLEDITRSQELTTAVQVIDHISSIFNEGLYVQASFEVWLNLTPQSAVESTVRCEWTLTRIFESRTYTWHPPQTFEWFLLQTAAKCFL